MTKDQIVFGIAKLLDQYDLQDLHWVQVMLSRKYAEREAAWAEDGKKIRPWNDGQPKF